MPAGERRGSAPHVHGAEPPREPAAAERRRELVEAFLAGYGQAVEDFGAYVGGRARTVPSRRWWALLGHRDRADGG